jgi:hypothetical protein
MRNKRASFDALFARFQPEPGSSVIFFIIIAETGSEEGVKSETQQSISVWLPRSRGAKLFV